MTVAIKLSALAKQGSGKGPSRLKRREGRIPAIVYGGNSHPEMVSVSKKDFLKEYLKGGIKTKLIELDLEGKQQMALLHAIQTHPVSDDPIHLDFLRVDTNTKVRVNVAVKILNEDKAPGVKRGGVVNVVTRYIELWCNPANIPAQIEIDIKEMEIGHNLHINDLSLPEGVAPYHKDNFTVVSISGRTSEEEAKPEAAAATTA